LFYSAATLSITREKGSHARMFHVSAKLFGMINKLPKNQPKYSATMNCADTEAPSSENAKNSQQTPKLKNKQNNLPPFRHWKATMEYHKTKDILHVMRLLGHKNIKILSSTRSY
jgi:hypothetical protein